MISLEELKNDFKGYGAKGMALLACLTAIASVLLFVSIGKVASSAYDPMLVWVLLAMVIALTSARHPITFPGTSTSVSVSEALVFLGVLVLGPHHGVLLAVAEMVLAMRQLKLKRSLYLFNISNVTISFFAAGQIYYELHNYLATHQLASGMAQALLAFSIPLVALALAHYSLHIIVLVLMSLARGRRARQVVRDTLPWEPVTYLACATVAGMVNYAVVHKGLVITAVIMVLVLPVPVIIYYTFKTYHDKLGEQQHHYHELTGIYDSILEMLAMAIDAKDDVTHDHIQRVKLFAKRMGELAGLTDLEIEALKAGALLHDIGKIGVPAYILNKPGKLTEHEFEQMKMHTIIGADMLSNVDFRYPVVPIVRHHHERWDGRGYPDGLRGDEIPITARILTVADCFDAVREDRQYRKAMTREQAISLLKEGSGTVFDPTVVGVFLDHLNDFESEIRENHIEPKMVEPPLQKGMARPLKPISEPLGLEQIRSAHREVITLYDIAQTIGTSLDLRDTFAVFSSRLEDIVHYTTCVLYLVKQDSTDIEAAHASGRNSEKLKGGRIPSGAGITGWVVAHRHPMHNCDPRLDFDVMRLSFTEQYRAAIVVPLMRDDVVLGALALYSAEMNSYTADHLRLAEAVAKLASDAIANAVRHERTENTALTDLLTGLPNARALRYRFEEEIDRARRHSDRFCVMMMDLDGFKNINDKFGHQAGDHVLRELAQVLLSQLRSTDFVGRYAGDEFVAVMQVGPEEARELGNRIQRAIDRHEFGFNGSKLFIGISVGWACFGTEGDTLDQLLLAADRAMYADKAKRKAAYGDSRVFSSGDLGQYNVM